MTKKSARKTKQQSALSRRMKAGPVAAHASAPRCRRNIAVDVGIVTSCIRLLIDPLAAHDAEPGGAY